MEAMVDVFEERLNRMDNTDLEANRENSEVVVVHQEFPNKEATVETVGAPEDQSVDEEAALGYCSPRKADQGLCCTRSL
jgi:hypothetical protein